MDAKVESRERFLRVQADMLDAIVKEEQRTRKECDVLRHAYAVLREVMHLHFDESI